MMTGKSIAELEAEIVELRGKSTEDFSEIVNLRVGKRRVKNERNSAALSLALAKAAIKTLQARIKAAEYFCLEVKHMPARIAAIPDIPDDKEGAFEFGYDVACEGIFEILTGDTPQGKDGG